MKLTLEDLNEIKLVPVNPNIGDEFSRHCNRFVGLPEEQAFALIQMAKDSILYRQALEKHHYERTTELPEGQNPYLDSWLCNQTRKALQKGNME